MEIVDSKKMQSFSSQLRMIQSQHPEALGDLQFLPAETIEEILLPLPYSDLIESLSHCATLNKVLNGLCGQRIHDPNFWKELLQKRFQVNFDRLRDSILYPNPEWVYRVLSEGIPVQIGSHKEHLNFKELQANLYVIGLFQSLGIQTPSIKLLASPPIAKGLDYLNNVKYITQKELMHETLINPIPGTEPLYSKMMKDIFPDYTTSSIFGLTTSSLSILKSIPGYRGYQNIQVSIPSLNLRPEDSNKYLLLWVPTSYAPEVMAILQQIPFFLLNPNQ